MRCMLAGVLIQSADIMILDEPTNFLDILGVIWLEKYLVQSREETDKTVILVSRDREFLDNVCEEIVIIKDQSLKYFKGNLSEYEDDLRSQRLYWGRMEEAQDRQIAHMEASSEITSNKERRRVTIKNFAWQSHVRKRSMTGWEWKLAQLVGGSSSAVIGSPGTIRCVLKLKSRRKRKGSCSLFLMLMT